MPYYLSRCNISLGALTATDHYEGSVPSVLSEAGRYTFPLLRRSPDEWASTVVGLQASEEAAEACFSPMLPSGSDRVRGLLVSLSSSSMLSPLTSALTFMLHKATASNAALTAAAASSRLKVALGLMHALRIFEDDPLPMAFEWQDHAGMRVGRHTMVVTMQLEALLAQSAAVIAADGSVDILRAHSATYAALAQLVLDDDAYGRRLDEQASTSSLLTSSALIGTIITNAAALTAAEPSTEVVDLAASTTLAIVEASAALVNSSASAPVEDSAADSTAWFDMLGQHSLAASNLAAHTQDVAQQVASGQLAPDQVGAAVDADGVADLAAAQQQANAGMPSPSNFLCGEPSAANYVPGGAATADSPACEVYAPPSPPPLEDSTGPAMPWTGTDTMIISIILPLVLLPALAIGLYMIRQSREHESAPKWARHEDATGDYWQNQKGMELPTSLPKTMATSTPIAVEKFERPSEGLMTVANRPLAADI